MTTETTPAARPCPICGGPAASPRHHPFCSARCADLDLHRWLGEVYRVEGDEGDEGDEGERTASS